MSGAYETRFQWGAHELPDGRLVEVAWLARKDSLLRKLEDYVRFVVEQKVGEFTLSYAPNAGARTTLIGSFATADEAKRYAEVIWIMGIADDLWVAVPYEEPKPNPLA